MLRITFRSYQTFVRDIQKCKHGKFMFCQNRSFSDTDSPSDPGDNMDKPTTNYPIVKNFFLGRSNASSLVFPEVLSKDELGDLNALVQPIEKFFNEDLDSKAIDEAASIPEDVLNTVKDLGLFGQQIPVDYGGLGLNATMYARIAEITALDGAIGVTLAAHQAIGLKGILIAGTKEQKEKYLPKLATGEHVAAFALTEPSSGSDAASIQTKADLSVDGSHYKLNGGKIWISNGGIADVFTVFAKTSTVNSAGEYKVGVTAFIVERAFGGITNGKPEDKLGIRGSNTCEVHFEDTPVPIENVIGEVGGGFKVAMNILNSGRFSMGSSVAGMHRKLIAMAAEHAISRTQFGEKLMNFGMIQEKFAKMALRCYVMESMAYMTAGILDNHEKPDASVEAAIVKVYSSEAAWESISECVQILGGLGYMKDYPYERYLRDSRILLIFEGTNEILRLYIALTGAQYAGIHLSDIMTKVKKPLTNLGAVSKLVYERFQKKMGAGKTIHKAVHPNLRECADAFEDSLHQFQLAVEQSLSFYGKNVVNEQLSLKRLADMAIDLYAMNAVLARCSRSLSIGIKNADHEFLLTCTFMKEACERIEKKSNEILEGSLSNGDENLKQIAETLFKNHGYAAQHPLEKNW